MDAFLFYIFFFLSFNTFQLVRKIIEMLFAFIFAALFTLISCANQDSASIGSISIKPLDYDKYHDTIDLQLVRFYPNGTVFFFDSSNKGTVSNETLTVRNAEINHLGQFKINSTADKPYFLNIDPVSGVMNATKDGSTSSGIFYVTDGVVYFNYHSVFVACRAWKTGNVWNLSWRGASSSLVCENDWLLVKLNAYGSNSGPVSEYKPDNFAFSIAQTAVENTATTTATVGKAQPSTAAAAASSNFANALEFSGASWTAGGIVAVVAAYLLRL